MTTEMKANSPTQIPAYGAIVRDVEVIDGDSVRVTRDLGFHHWDSMICRLQGIDTPEKTTLAGQLVAAVAEQWVKDNPRLACCSYSMDKFANRFIGSVFAIDSQNFVEESLTDYLRRNKLCQPYDGGKKAEWTNEQLIAVEAKARQLLA